MIRTVPHGARFNIPEGPHILWQPQGEQGLEGVHGYAIQDQGPGALWLPVLMGMPPGKGHLGAMLEALPRDRTIVVPNIVSKQLKDMLHRRGFMAAYVLPPKEAKPGDDPLCTYATRPGPWNEHNARAIVKQGVPVHPYEVRDGWWQP